MRKFGFDSMATDSVEIEPYLRLCTYYDVGENVQVIHITNKQEALALIKVATAFLLHENAHMSDLDFK